MVRSRGARRRHPRFHQQEVVMSNQSLPVSRTRSFSTVFLIEMWERFGYYGMQALIVYYMVQRLGFSDDRANLTWGAAAALIYVAPAIGGWIGDKILGTRRTMLTRRGRTRPGLCAHGGAQRRGAVPVLRAGRDRGWQWPVQGQRRQPGAQDLRGRRQQNRQRLHHLLHGGEHRLHGVNAADSLDQGLLQSSTSGNGLGWHAAFAVCASA